MQSGRLDPDATPDPERPPEIGDGFDAALRSYRDESLAVIAYRDMAGLDTLETTLGALTVLADFCIEAALLAAEASVAARHGVIRDANGAIQRLCVMGMGKLGGCELNFSSDIDLIFAYRKNSESDGANSLDAQAYYRKVAQRLVKTLHKSTADGFVYRVDTRLRPFGDAGALVASFAAMENYYQTHGREWERYAWIKARPVAGDLEAGQALCQLLRPFVYRRYLDYGTFESIRDMKAMIERQIRQGGLETNIKLGRGGIREIEFMVQAFQLIRGGQQPDLQGQQLLPTMARLVEDDHLPAHQGDELEAAYRLLRRIENRLQMVADRQTHDLPKDPDARQRLAESLGYADWDTFDSDLSATRNTVQGAFEQVFASPQAQGPDALDGREACLMSLWDSILDQSAAASADALAEYRVTDCETVTRELADLKRRVERNGVEQRGRRWLKKLLPTLFEIAESTQSPDLAMTRVLPVVGAIIGRSNYLALLVEHPGALSTLVRLCVGSLWITQRIGEQPALLDNLLDPRQLFRPPSRNELSAELDDELASAGDDLEQQMNVLRHFTQATKLRIAAADVTDAMPLMTVSDRLSELAEVIVEKAVDMAWSQIEDRHGVLCDAESKPAPFGVIAYGKLGGLELGYTSDLDLVFVFDCDPELASDGKRPLTAQVYFTRLAQRVIHILATNTPAGRAFEVDMRLRPSGRSGLMVSHIEAYAKYQQRTAWTWEHQALVRARFVVGPAELAERFRAIRAGILARPCNADDLAAEVRDMRRRMRQAKDQSDAEQADVKQMPGGLIDIEFMAQFAVLRYGHYCPELVIFSDAIRILETLESGGLAKREDIKTLTDAYRDYRRRIHSQSLQLERAMIPADALTGRRNAVAALWSQYLGQA